MLIATLLGLVFLNGITVDSRETLQETSTKAPFEFIIKAREDRICIGSPLTVQAKLKNTSSEPIAIDPRLIWYRISFRTFKSTLQGGEGKHRTIVGHPDQDDEGKYLILNPGELYEDSRTLSLDDDFFLGDGTYKIRMTYGSFREGRFGGSSIFNGTFTSNEVSFQIIRCQRKIQ
jgi:hypothetical protein